MPCWRAAAFFTPVPSTSAVTSNDMSGESLPRWVPLSATIASLCATDKLWPVEQMTAPRNEKSSGMGDARDRRGAPEEEADEDEAADDADEEEDA